MEDCKDKTPYIPPRAIVTVLRNHGMLCSSFDGSGTEGIGPGGSYDDNTFNT